MMPGNVFLGDVRPCGGVLVCLLACDKLLC